MIKLLPSELELYMALALEEAARAASRGEVPVGAVLAVGGEVIAQAGNRVEEEQDPTAHAEQLVLRAGAKKLANWRLNECVLVATLEPCAMCAGAIRQARVPAVVFGALDPKAGACGSVLDLLSDTALGPVPRVISEVKEAQCSELLKTFFERRRAAR